MNRLVSTTLGLLGPLFACLLFDGAASTAAAQSPSFEPRDSLRKTNQEILDSPEFRHFRKSQRGSRYSRGRSGGQGEGEGEFDGDGRRGADGEGRPGEGNGNFDPNRRFPRGEAEQGARRNPRNRAPREAAPASDSGFSGGSTFGSFGSGASAIFQALGWIVVAVMLGLIAYLIIKAIKDREQSVPSDIQSGSAFEIGELEPEHPPGELPSDVYVSRARELAGRGEFRAAVAQLMLGAMSHVERHGFIRYRKGLTQRDYLRAVRGRAPMSDSYKQMLRIYEPLGFGRRAATRDHFDKSLDNYTAGFHARPAISQN